jgi:hypothetical protein
MQAEQHPVLEFLFPDLICRPIAWQGPFLFQYNEPIRQYLVDVLHCSKRVKFGVFLVSYKSQGPLALQDGDDISQCCHERFMVVDTTLIATSYRPPRDIYISIRIDPRCDRRVEIKATMTAAQLLGSLEEINGQSECALLLRGHIIEADAVLFDCGIARDESLLVVKTAKMRIKSLTNPAQRPIMLLLSPLKIKTLADVWPRIRARLEFAPDVLSVDGRELTTLEAIYDAGEVGFHVGQAPVAVATAANPPRERTAPQYRAPPPFPPPPPGRAARAKRAAHPVQPAPPRNGSALPDGPVPSDGTHPLQPAPRQDLADHAAVRVAEERGDPTKPQSQVELLADCLRTLTRQVETLNGEVQILKGEVQTLTAQRAADQGTIASQRIKD